MGKVTSAQGNAREYKSVPLVENHQDAWSSDDLKADVFTQLSKATPLLQRFALSLTKNSADAEDLFSDSRVKIINAFHQYDSTRKFLSWASQILMRTFLDNKRTISRRPTTVSYDQFKESTGNDIAYAIADPEALHHLVTVSLIPEVAAIRAARSKLENSEKVLFDLHIIQELSIEQIAKKLSEYERRDIHTGTVRSRIFRMKKKVKQYVQRSNDLPNLPGRD